MKTTTVKLSTSLRIGGKDIDEFTVRASTVGDEEDAMQDAVLMDRAKNVLTVEMALLARMASIPYNLMRTLSGEDYARIREAYNSLMAPAKQQENPTEDGTPANS